MTMPTFALFFLLSLLFLFAGFSFAFEPLQKQTNGAYNGTDNQQTFEVRLALVEHRQGSSEDTLKRIEMLISGLDKKVGSLNETLSTKIENLGETLSTKIENLGETIENLNETLNAKIENLGETLSTKIENLGETLSTKIDNLGQTLNTKIDKLIERTYIIYVVLAIIGAATVPSILPL
jgi:predicted  nucleic acid-binding Zn-ribbon protein